MIEQTSRRYSRESRRPSAPKPNASQAVTASVLAYGTLYRLDLQSVFAKEHTLLVQVQRLACAPIRYVLIAFGSVFRSTLIALAIILACTRTVIAEDVICLNLYEDSSGNLLKTRELAIYQSGRITEETYDWMTAGKNDPYRFRELPSLTSAELAKIQRIIVENDFRSLPGRVEAEGGIFPDARFRSIRLTESGSSFAVEWNAFTNSPRTSEGQRFDRIWRAIVAIIDARTAGAK